jgi:putative N6-adenine-specific DNA methylase
LSREKKPTARQTPPTGPDPLVGRGGLKLQAAVERYGLADALRGARAVDVGASTGGFTEVMLRHGAAHVLAVDVGRDQLHERLRADPRVESLEGTDWKRLALGIAPGPYDFFSVDVSFVAARSMLRSLAFRLRPGAQGVVLVKPQFELPDALVRGGDVSDPALRARAVDLFRTKAESLGFTLVAHEDSPVAGGSGTVEILAHLRFEGRSDRLPAPGERRRKEDAPPARGKRARLPDRHTWFLVAAPGLEEGVRAEALALPGATNVRAVDGGVEFDGDLAVGFAANLHLRIATRVLLRVGHAEAREFGKLRHRLAKLPWETLVPADRPLRVTASVSRCRLYHTGGLAETVALALEDRVGRLAAAPKGEEGVEHDDAEVTRVLLRGVEDRFTVSLDASGALLHRRGWRQEAGAAPLRETLAAGLLALADHDPALPFVDPMCGSGTILLEACARALGVAPGLGRTFAIESWPAFDPAIAARLRAEAQAAARPAPPAPLWGFDRDPRMVEVARRNAARAGFGAHVTIEAAAFGERDAPAGPAGLLVTNPPYGRRLGAGGSTERLYKDLGRTLRARYPGWRAGVLAPDARAVRALGLPRGGREHRLVNGGLKIAFVVGGGPRGQATG